MHFVPVHAHDVACSDSRIVGRYPNTDEISVEVLPIWSRCPYKPIDCWPNFFSQGQEHPSSNAPYLKTEGRTKIRHFHMVWDAHVRPETRNVLSMNWWPVPCWRVHGTCFKYVSPFALRLFSWLKSLHSQLINSLVVVCELCFLTILPITWLWPPL